MKTILKKRGHRDANPHPKDCKATILSTTPRNLLDIFDKIFRTVCNKS